MDAAAVTVPNTNVLETLKRSPGVVRVVPDFIIHNQTKGSRGGPRRRPLLSTLVK